MAGLAGRAIKKVCLHFVVFGGTKLIQPFRPVRSGGFTRVIVASSSAIEEASFYSLFTSRGWCGLKKKKNAAEILQVFLGTKHSCGRVRERFQPGKLVPSGTSGLV